MLLAMLMLAISAGMHPPAAPSVWPKQALLDSSASGTGPPAHDLARPWPSAPISMGSPRGVPVPCTLTVDTAEGVRPPEASAVRMSAVCEGPLGAVRPLERPSCMHDRFCLCRPR